MSKPKVKNSSNKRKKSKSNISPHIFSAKILFFIGLLFLAIYLIYHAHYLAILSFRHPPSPTAVISTPASKPIQIVIKRLKVDLPVYETIITDNFWEIAQNGASYLAASGKPGENNTTILYAHNTNNRFGPLLWMEKGDEIEIKTLDEKNYLYTVTDIQNVDPGQTRILTSQKGETLILYTCTGFADLQRHVIIAKPQSVKISIKNYSYLKA